MYSVIALIKKELLMILKDSKSRRILIIPTIMQTFLFGYVATYDITKIDHAILDNDRTQSSTELINRFESSGIFQRKYTLENASQIPSLIDNKKVTTVIVIEEGFEKKLLTGNDAGAEVILDARNSNRAAVISGYVNEIVLKFMYDLQNKTVPEIRSRSWYNPNMETRWSMITGIIGALAMLQNILLTAMSVAREREQGTFDQLLVTPLSSNQILIGKALPPIFIGLLQASLVILIARLWFRIPLAGSHIVLYTGLAVFLLAVVGIGLMISAISENMQQGMLYSFIIIMPVILLSGMVTPIKTMPEIMQVLTNLNPLRHALTIIRGVYLEGSGFNAFHKEFIILIIMAAVLLPLAGKLFRKFS